MPRGKKTTPELIYKIMTGFAITQNKNETAKLLGVSEATVRKIIKENENNPEFTKLCEQKRADFSEHASRIIDKALKRLEQTIDDIENAIPVNHLTTVIGTLYDKKALADGNATDNVKIEIKLPEGVDEYAE